MQANAKKPETVEFLKALDMCRKRVAAGIRELGQLQIAIDNSEEKALQGNLDDQAMQDVRAELKELGLRLYVDS